MQRCEIIRNILYVPTEYVMESITAILLFSCSVTITFVPSELKATCSGSGSSSSKNTLCATQVE